MSSIIFIVDSLTSADKTRKMMYRLTVGRTFNKKFETLSSVLACLQRSEFEHFVSSGDAFIYRQDADVERCIACFDLNGMGNPPSKGVAGATS